ncbi:hypothetical protein OG21DRAFT_1488911 [Imleria badia]|nr:hypothetical protein OG21DRAFT_1488911 [Imleria badia]
MKPDTNHITIALTTNPKSATVHHVHHCHSYCPLITTGLTTNTKPDTIPLRPTISAALSATTKSDTDPNDITITYLECQIRKTDIATTSDIETDIESDRPMTDTDTTTPTVTNSNTIPDDHPVTSATNTTTDNLANTTSATDVTSDRSPTDTDTTTLTATNSGTVPYHLTATDIAFALSIDSFVLHFSSIALTVATVLSLTTTNRQYPTIVIRHCLTSTITNPTSDTNLDYPTNVPTAITKSASASDYPTTAFDTATNRTDTTKLPTAITKSATVSDYPTTAYTTNTDRITDTDHTTDITKTDMTPNRWYFVTTGLDLFPFP